jgi:hypothetical protein
MVDIPTFDIIRREFGNKIALTKCYEIQLRLGALEGNFVLTNAKEVKATYNGVTESFYELYHDGNYVGTTNQSGYDTARGL